MSTSIATAKRSIRKGTTARRGMTLAEVIYCVFVLALIAAGVLAVVTTSYRMGVRARLNNGATAVLRTYADQFISSKPENITDAAAQITDQIFIDLDGNTAATGGTSAISEEVIGQNGSGDVKATITRTVQFVNIATGAATDSAEINGTVQNQAGYYMQATFTASYEFSGETITISFTALKSCI